MKTSSYEPVIGIEIHAQVSTKTKMFCACSNDSFGAQPNVNVCPVCMGFPGMLPAINKKVVEKGTLAALALHCSIPQFSKFDRKNYFYPDLPKGFQISQYDKPLSQNGFVEIPVEGADGGKGAKKRIRVNRLHLEDDAGKLIHTADGTLCDYNRTGTPLMEIVSEPDLNSTQEASAYAQEIRRILRYVGASECDMEKGMMRFDINVSVRKKGVKELGTKTEVKNLNSFRALERAIDYEIKRQAQRLDAGERIIQETMGWDDATGETVSQRSKEEAHDYRYFPEPDLPPLEISQKDVEKMRVQIPELPAERKARFVSEYGLIDEDAGILTEERDMADFFETVAKTSGDAKKAVSFINTILLKHLKGEKKELADCKVKAQDLGVLIKLINDGVISNNMAKTDIFEEMYAEGLAPEKIIEKKGLKLVSDAGAIEAICKKVIEKNPGPVTDFKGGKDAAIGFLVGQVMKEAKGQANPKMVSEVLRRLC